jgi:hypothetical protein
MYENVSMKPIICTNKKIFLKDGSFKRWRPGFGI